MSGASVQLGSVWLASMFKSSQAVPITYKQGNSSVDTVATRGATSHEGFGPDGIKVRYQQLEWIIAATDLGAIPKIGDTLTNGVTVYEVTNGGSFNVCWEWCGGTMVHRKVYTKLS